MSNYSSTKVVLLQFPTWLTAIILRLELRTGYSS